MSHDPSEAPPLPVDCGTMLRHVASPHIIDCPLGDGLALLDNRTGEYFSLNGTAALLWRAAKAPATREELLAMLSRAPGASDSAGTIVHDLDSALKQFLDLGLFQPVPAAMASLDGSTG